MVRGSPSLAVLGVARVEAEEGMWAGVWGRSVVVTTEGGVERERFMNGHGSCQGSIFSETEVLREHSETNAYGLSLCRGVEGGN